MKTNLLDKKTSMFSTLCCQVLPTTRAMLEGGSGAAAGRSGWPVSKAFLPLSPRCHHGPRSALLALLLPPCWQIFTSLALRPLLCMDAVERIYRHVFTLLGAGRGPGKFSDLAKCCGRGVQVCQETPTATLAFRRLSDAAKSALPSWARRV